MNYEAAEFEAKLIGEVDRMRGLASLDGAVQSIADAMDDIHMSIYELTRRMDSNADGLLDSDEIQTGIYIDAFGDMCSNACVEECRHVWIHVSRHVCRPGCRHVCVDMFVDVCMGIWQRRGRPGSVYRLVCKDLCRDAGQGMFRESVITQVSRITCTSNSLSQK